ncbi:MAG: hypothetical protein CM15mP98_02270 [Paracoccaceae bacterium]|nr:MAG: hypothetical protein CM15mP98_02270 [Paracoccaceae bacterium]
MDAFWESDTSYEMGIWVKPGVKGFYFPVNPTVLDKTFDQNVVS